MSITLARYPGRVFRVAKAACLLAALTGSMLLAQGRQSFFGITGLTFIPTAGLAPAGTFMMSYSSLPGAADEVNLIPYSVRLGYRTQNRRLEVSLTNTYLYASASLDSTAFGVNVKNIGLPMVPSFKYQIAPMSAATGNSAMAFGVTAPYGAFYAYDRYIGWKRIGVTLHAGIASKLVTYHVFTGATIQFGSAGPDYTRSLPFRIIFEGSWGGSLKNLKEKEESFWAITSIYQWTQNLAVETYLRFDGQYRLDNLTRVASRHMGIGLGYTIGGAK